MFITVLFIIIKDRSIQWLTVGIAKWNCWVKGNILLKFWDLITRLSSHFSCVWRCWLPLTSKIQHPTSLSCELDINDAALWFYFAFLLLWMRLSIFSSMCLFKSVSVLVPSHLKKNLTIGLWCVWACQGLGLGTPGLVSVRAHQAPPGPAG